MENVQSKLLDAARNDLHLFGRTIKVQIEPVRQFDLEANPDEIRTLLDGHIYDEPAGQIVQDVVGNLVILFEFLSVLHVGNGCWLIGKYANLWYLYFFFKLFFFCVGFLCLDLDVFEMLFTTTTTTTL